MLHWGLQKKTVRSVHASGQYRKEKLKKKLQMHKYMRLRRRLQSDFLDASKPLLPAFRRVPDELGYVETINRVGGKVAPKLVQVQRAWLDDRNKRKKKKKAVTKTKTREPTRLTHMAIGALHPQPRNKWEGIQKRKMTKARIFFLESKMRSPSLLCIDRSGLRCSACRRGSSQSKGSTSIARQQRAQSPIQKQH